MASPPTYPGGSYRGARCSADYEPSTNMGQQQQHQRHHLLKRSNTVGAGIESFSSLDPGPSGARHGGSNTVGFGSGLSHGKTRDASGLGARRQTLSNVGQGDYDNLLTSQARTMSYSQHPSPGLTSPQPRARLRERAPLQTGQLEAKVVILGSQGVGKTSLVDRYTSGQFRASSLPSTIGASFLTKKLIVDGVKVRLQLWDTAGQERFRSMAPMYYRGSNAAVIVYDITSMQSFVDVKSWIEELRKNMASDLVIHIVGAKMDLAPSSRAVELDFARSTIRSWVRPAVTPPDSPKALTHSTSLSRGTSRLTGLGNLAIGSASRFASFPRNNSPPTPVAAKQGSSGSGGSSGSNGSGRNRDALNDLDVAGSSAFPSWEQIEVSEVSVKDDEGIQDVFLAVTKKLVERKSVIESERLSRQRDSIVMSDDGWEQGGDRPNPSGIPNQSSWSCCT